MEGLRKFGVIVGLLLLTYFVATWWTGNNIEKDSRPTQITQPAEQSYDEIEVYVMSQQLIEHHLVSPSTADFPVLPKAVQEVSTGVYRVLSYVDSQNAFGGVVRTDYLIQFSYADSKGIAEWVALDGIVVAGVMK